MPIITTKVSGINSLTDARYCAGMGVQFLGLPFDESGGGNLDRNAFVSISGWIEGPKWVAEYEGNDWELIKKISEDYEISFWQIRDFELAKKLNKEGFLVALTLNPEEFQPENPLWKSIPWQFIQLQAGGEGKDSETLPMVQFFAGMGIPILLPVQKMEELNYLRNRFPDAGICLQSGQEERPGWMDLSGLQDVLEAIENEEEG